MRAFFLVAFGALNAAGASSPLPDGRYQLDACGIHRYRVELRAGESLRGAVIQDGVDVEVSVRRTSDDLVIFEQNRWDTGGGRERFLVPVARDGEYEIVLRAHEGAGFYTLESAPLEPTTAGELLEYAAETEITAMRGTNFSGIPLRTIRAKLEEALEGCRIVRSTECEADAMMALAHAHWFAVEDVRGARDLLVASLPLRARSPDRYAEGQTYNDLGVITRWLGELHEARDYLERVPPLKRLTTAENDPLVLLNSGPVYWQLGELQKAIDTEKRALEYWSDPAHPDFRGQAYVRNILAQFALQLGDTDEALQQVTEARRIFHAIMHGTGVVETTARLGAVHEARGDRARALQWYREALRLAEKIFDRQGQANALLGIGRTLNAMKRPLEARRSLETALTILRTGNRDETPVHLALGAVHVTSKNNAAATDAYRRVLELTAKSGEMASRAEALLGIARIKRDRGHLEDALQSLDDAQEILETLRARIGDPAVRASYFAARQTQHDLMINVLMRLKRTRDALAVSERARARSLLDSLLVARVRDAGVDAQLLDREESVRQRLNGKATAFGRLTVPQREGSEGAALRREIDSIVAQYQHIRGEVARAGGSESAPTLNVREIQRLLDADTLVLEYALGESASYLWVVGRNSLHAFTLPPRATIDRLARRVIELLPQTYKRELGAQSQLALQKLSAAILDPSGELLGRKRLAIVADGALQFVSFAALPDPAMPEQPLIVDHEVVALPSASLLAVMRKPIRRGNERKTIAVLADPVVSLAAVTDPDLLRSAEAMGENAFGRLLHTRREARRIAALVPAADRLVALDYAANRSVATNGTLAAFRMVHFATHGFIHGQHPELSGLVLSLYDVNGKPQDGFLRLADIYGMRLSADLVVLSACRTALGADMRREGLVGLTRGFIAAGAPRVVASLWDVRDSATAELMERFYRHMLRDRMTPAAALRRAQVSMVREPKFRAPFYWAAFVLHGEWLQHQD